MDQEEARARMREVQRIMERTTLYTLLPGAPAVVGGVLVLIGCAASYGMLRSLDFAAILRKPAQTAIIFYCMWLAIGAIGVVQEVIMTGRAARREGASATARPARVAAFSLTPSVVVAMVLTWKFLVRAEPRPEEVRYIAPIWMMLYGTGVYTAGLFSVRPPRILGLAFIAMGALALLLFQGYGVVTAALSFGLLHIVLGLYIIQKSRQSRQT